MKITFLGTGTSHGVPVVGCECETCRSNHKRNKRYRSSIYIKSEDQTILIDTPPELRLQLLENKIKDIDAILYTHAHADHLMGFDDIRAINHFRKKVIPCYGSHETINSIQNIFSYIFNPTQEGGGLPQVTLNQVNTPFYIGSTLIQPLPVKHGKLHIFGYRIGKIAYITDCSYIPQETYLLLKDLEILIIDALRHRPHPTHMNIQEALEVIKKLNVSRAYLTHLSHNIEHEKVSRELPDNVRLAYDGLQIGIY